MRRNEERQLRLSRRDILYGVAAVVVIWLAWTVAILVHASGVNLIGWLGFNPEKTLDSNEFGDSFGSLSALMATLAAAGVLATLYVQGREQRSQIFENNFYQLLSQFRMTIQEIRIDQYDLELFEDGSERSKLAQTYLGRDAFEVMVDELNDAVAELWRPWDLVAIRYTYLALFTKYHSDLSLYFRTSYHIFKTIADKCPDDEYFYARLARAQLSNSELILLGYNCIFGEGRHRYIHYLREYGILNNIVFLLENDQHGQVLYRCLDRRCFGDLIVAPVVR